MYPLHTLLCSFTCLYVPYVTVCTSMHPYTPLYIPLFSSTNSHCLFVPLHASMHLSMCTYVPYLSTLIGQGCILQEFMEPFTIPFNFCMQFWTSTDDQNCTSVLDNEEDEFTNVFTECSAVMLFLSRLILHAGAVADLGFPRGGAKPYGGTNLHLIIFSQKLHENKKVLLRECKRHTARCVARTHCAALSPRRGVYPFSPNGGGIPPPCPAGRVPPIGTRWWYPHIWTG